MKSPYRKSNSVEGCWKAGLTLIHKYENDSKFYLDSIGVQETYDSLDEAKKYAFANVWRKVKLTK